MGLALMAAAMTLVLDALVHAAGTSAGRLQRTSEVGQAARAAEQITWDLERAVVTEDGPRVTLEGRGAVIPVREGGTTVAMWYRFDPQSGALERGHPTRGYARVGALPFAAVVWSADAAPGGAVAVTVSLKPRLAAEASHGPTPVSTRAVEIVSGRVVEPAECGEGPPGWQEPSKDVEP